MYPMPDRSIDLESVIRKGHRMTGRASMMRFGYWHGRPSQRYAFWLLAWTVEPALCVLVIDMAGQGSVIRSDHRDLRRYPLYHRFRLCPDQPVHREFRHPPFPSTADTPPR